MCALHPLSALRPLLVQGVGVLASHSNGTLQYNTHNLYGLTMAQATAISLRVIKNSRPFILTRWACWLHYHAARQPFYSAVLTNPRILAQPARQTAPALSLIIV